MTPNQNDPPPSTVNKLRFIWVTPVTVIGLFALMLLAGRKWDQWFADDQTLKPMVRPAPKSVGGGSVTAIKPGQVEAKESSAVEAAPSTGTSPTPEPVAPVSIPAALPPAAAANPAPLSTPAGAPAQTNIGRRISGRARLQGVPPPERLLPLDALCGQLHTTQPTTRFYVVNEEGRLADVFVYIKSGVAGNSFPIPAQPVLLDQVGCEYTPYILGLQTRQKLVVRNSDPFLHNVHPMPVVAGNRESNRAQLPKVDLEFTFEQPELFLKFKCDVHPWMFAYVCLLDHPFFAVTDRTGAFALPNLPPGKYVIEAAHRKAGTVTQEIIIGTEETPPLDFIFEAKPGP